MIVRAALLVALVAASPAVAAEARYGDYLLHCSGCHGRDGRGIPAKGIPDLHEAWMFSGTAEGRRYLVQVPGIATSRLDDAGAAAMLNYVLAAWSDGHLPDGFVAFTGDEVAASRGRLETDAVVKRAALRWE
jgi:mono/diheme cytochrome c family protein